MKISVILPIYNTDKYLKDALDSIINQSYRDLEIICVDDGSTDNCPDILRDYQLKDSRISVITQKNMGTYLARRRGVENAHGDYILFVDPDDWLDIEACATIVATLETHDVDILQYGFVIEPEGETDNEKILNIDRFFNRRLDYVEGKESLLTESYLNETISYNQCGKVFKTSLVQKAFSVMPRVRCTYAEDMCSGFFLYYFANTYKAIQNCFYHYRVGVGISTKSSLTLSEYKQTLESFHMLGTIEHFIEEYHLPQNPYSLIVDKIKKTMVSTGVTFGQYRLKDSCQLNEWIIPLCSFANPTDIACYFAQEYQEVTNSFTYLKNKFRKEKRRRIFWTISCIIILVVLLLLIALS